MRTKYRSANDGKDQEYSDLSAYHNEDPSMTVQSQAQEADINWIVKTYGATAQLPTSSHLPEYGDYTEITDYRSAIEAVRRAQHDFNQFDAQTRAYFENDPQKLLEFVMNGNNREEAIRLGLIPKPQVQTPPPEAAPAVAVQQKG